MIGFINSKMCGNERVEAKKLFSQGDAIPYGIYEWLDFKGQVEMMKKACLMEISEASSYMLLLNSLHEKNTCHGPVEPPVKRSPQLLRLQPPIGGGQC